VEVVSVILLHNSWAKSHHYKQFNQIVTCALSTSSTFARTHM